MSARVGFTKLLTALLTAALLSALAATPVSAASEGMPRGLVKCGGTVNIDAPTLVTGRIYNRGAVFRYWVRIHAQPPLGWSGTITFDGVHKIGTGWIPIGTSRSYPSFWIIPWRPTASTRYSVRVEPGEGVINGYSTEVFAPYRCTFAVR